VLGWMAIERTRALRALKHLGKAATQFEFSFYVDRIENVPIGCDFIFSVQRGERLCSTSECRSVQLAYRSSGVVAFRELLVLPVTLYMNKHGGEFLPKYAKFFLRKVGKVGEEPKTQGKLHLDLSKLIRGTSTPEESAFQLSDGSKLFMTFSWKSSNSNWTNDSKDSISKALEKVVDEGLFGMKRESKECPRATSSKDNPSQLSRSGDFIENKERENGRQYSLDNNISKKPRALKVFGVFGEKNKSFDDSQTATKDVLQQVMEENAKLRKSLVDLRSEMGHCYQTEASQSAEISKLRSEIRGFREAYQATNCNVAESSREMERVVLTNQELQEQFKKLEERYKSQIRSLFCEVYKLREMVNPCNTESCNLGAFSREPLTVSDDSIVRDNGNSAYDLTESSRELRNDKSTQIHFLRQQFLLQREESANLLSDLIRTKVSLALALENIEWLSFQNRKLSGKNKIDNSGPLWTKILPWKFHSSNLMFSR